MLLVHMVPETDATSSGTHRTNAFRKTRPSRPFAKPFRMQKGILQANGYLETRNRNKMKYKTNPPFPASFPLEKINNKTSSRYPGYANWVSFQRGDMPS